MARGWKIWTALWIVYFVWGSTYSAIKVSVETLPPAALGRVSLHPRRSAARSDPRRPPEAPRRSVGTGPCGRRARGRTPRLWRRCRHPCRDADRLERRGRHRRIGAAAGHPLADDSHGSESRARPSSARRGSRRAALIVVPTGVSGGSSAVGLALMLGASISWSIGSFSLGRMPLPPDPFVSTVYEMLGAGLVLVVAALASASGTISRLRTSRRPRSLPGCTSRSPAR